MGRSVVVVVVEVVLVVQLLRSSLRVPSRDVVVRVGGMQARREGNGHRSLVSDLGGCSANQMQGDRKQ